MKKRLISVILVLASVLALVPFAASANDVVIDKGDKDYVYSSKENPLTLKVGSVSGKVSETVSVPVSFENVVDSESTALAAISFEINYDPAKLTYIDAAFDSSVVISNKNAVKMEDGVIRISATDGTNSVKTSGLFVTLNFKVNSSDTAILTKGGVWDFYSINFTELTPDFVGGSVTVEGAPTASPTTAPVLPSEKVDIKIGRDSASVGETLSVPVSFENIKNGIGAVCVEVKYDTEKLDFANAAFDSGVKIENKAVVETKDGVLRITATDGVNAITSNGTFVTLNFKVLNSGITKIVLGDILDLYDIYANEISANFYEGIVNSTTIKVESKPNVNKKDEFTVEVKLENNVGMNRLSVKPVIPGEFTVVSAVNGTVISDFTSGLNYVWVSSSDVTASGSLLTLTLKANDNVNPGDYEISFIVNECFNSEGAPVQVDVSKGTVTLVETLYGDVNGDGSVDDSDLVVLEKYMASYDYDTKTSTVEISYGADVNDDGAVNGKDLIRLSKYFANYDYETGTSTVPLGPKA